jgi:hypothetical protein
VSEAAVVEQVLNVDDPGVATTGSPSPALTRTAGAGTAIAGAGQTGSGSWNSSASADVDGGTDGPPGTGVGSRARGAVPVAIDVGVGVGGVDAGMTEPHPPSIATTSVAPIHPVRRGAITFRRALESTEEIVSSAVCPPTG